MQFDWVTFAFQIVNIGVLLLLLRHFFFRPVARVIAARQAETDKVLTAAKAAKAQAERAEAEAEAAQAQVANDRLAVMEAARAAAKTQAAEILAKAGEDARAAAAAAAETLARVDRDGRAARDARATETALLITRRLLDHLPEGALVFGYAARLKAAIAALSPEERAAIAASAETLHLLAPRALSPDEAAEAQAAVAGLAAGPLPIEVDASLLAGLELQGSHASLHNSLRHDLTQIAKALESRDPS